MIILSDDYRNDKSGENNDKFFSESNEIDDFFAQFDEIAEGLNKDDTAGSGNKHTDALSENNSVKSAADADILKEEAIAEFLSSTDAQKRKTRSERLAEEKELRKQRNRFSGIASSISEKCEVLFSKISRKAKEEFLVDEDNSESAENSAVGSSMTGKKRRKRNTGSM